MSSKEICLINTDRLKDNKTLTINGVILADDLALAETKVCFNRDIEVVGEAYIVENQLIVHVDVTASAFLPCSLGP